MPIRASLRTENDPLFEGTVLNDVFEDIHAEIGQQIEREIGPPLRDELAFDPGPVKYPIQWQSERQRRAYFATDGFGGGIPYQRSGRYQRGWAVRVVVDGGSFSLVVVNEQDYAQFVGGTLNFRTLGQFQQRMHINTGWLRSIDTVMFWFDAAQERYDELYEQSIADLADRGRFRRRSGR